MKVIFAGTPDFAAHALRAILAAGHKVPLVLTQPDRPAGRGMSLQASPVKKVAQEFNLPVFQPANLKQAADQAQIAEIAADVMVVAAYGLILPQVVLDMPRYGCINIHASLLPRWRGAAPIQRAMLAGDAETGICIMQMEAGLDTGPVLSRVSTPISHDDTASTLHDRLATLGAELIVRTLPELPSLQAKADIQASEGVTYAAKLEKAEAVIDWTQPASAIHRQLRAFNPFPGANTLWQGVSLKLWAADLVARDSLPPTALANTPPGTILHLDKTGIYVACGLANSATSTEVLCVRELQKAGGKRLPVMQFLAGNSLQVGQQFGASV